MSISFDPDGSFSALSENISCEDFLKLGRAAAEVLCRNGGRLLVGVDTRRSSAAFEQALTAGILSAGTEAVVLGAIPQPAGAYLVKKTGADGFIMTGCSDGEVNFCGAVIYGSDGKRIGEEAIERISEKLKSGRQSKTASFGIKSSYPDAIDDYASYILRNCSSDLSEMTIAADCANGAVSEAAEKLFSSFGAKVYLLNCDPDGNNINRECGTAHMESLSEFVRDRKCDIGIAFDGTGSKCLAVDENGTAIDGEKLLAVFAMDMRERGALKKNSVVVSASVNTGFSVFADENKIKGVTTRSGGRYIAEKLVSGGFSLGGEMSGNILFGDISSESDGLLTAVMLLSAVKQSGKKLSELCSVMERYPQVALNVKITEDWREVWKNIPELEEIIEKKEKELGGFGRIAVRENPSEPVVRVSVEGRRFDAVNNMAIEIAAAINRLCPSHK